MRKQLMTLANALRKTGLNLSDALKRAWFSVRLQLEMHRKPVSFFYTKDNGEERFAVGTYQTDELVTVGHFDSKYPLVVKYYDLLAQGWRSFRVDRLILC